MAPKAQTSQNAQTNVAVDVKFDVKIVRPYDSIDPVGQVLEEEPETQKGDAEIPALSSEASQQDQKQHNHRQETSNRIERVCRVDGGHVKVYDDLVPRPSNTAAL